MNIVNPIEKNHSPEFLITSTLNIDENIFIIGIWIKYNEQDIFPKNNNGFNLFTFGSINTNVAINIVAIKDATNRWFRNIILTTDNTIN